MKRVCATAAFALACAAAPVFAPAFAQVYPGEEVTVNPGAIGSNGYLLYPGGKYGRHVGHLLQPGEARSAPIHLHMPVKHPRVARKPKPAAALADAVPAPTAAAPASPAGGSDLTLSPDMAPSTPPPPVRHAAAPPPKPVKRTVAAAPPAQTPAPQPALGSSDALPEDSAARLFDPTATTAPAKPAPVRRASNPTPPPPAAPPRRTATATPAPATTSPPGGGAGLRRQSVIPFPAGASSPAMADVNAIHSLATTLNQALAGGAQKVQLEAYAGPRGDKSTESRRLSIKRALVIRELLIEDGVPSEKIDVRAMAGADDGGPADRVDVFVRA